MTLAVPQKVQVTIPVAAGSGAWQRVHKEAWAGMWPQCSEEMGGCLIDLRALVMLEGMSRMQAIVVRRFGKPEVLIPEEVECLSPGRGQVGVELRAIGVNFADTERRRAVYDVPTLPWIPGHEASGKVISFGHGVDAAILGKHVSFWSPHSTGGYAQQALVPVEHLFEFPSDVDFKVSAALPLQGLTAYGVLHHSARLAQGEWLFIHAAAGGVGLLAIQLARSLGARVLGTASSVAKRAAAAAFGATMLEPGPRLTEQVLELTDGRGVDVVIDSIGKDTQSQSLKMLAPFGRLVFFGEASGAPQPVVVEQLYPRSLSVGAFMLDPVLSPKLFAQARDGLVKQVVSGALRLTVAATVPLSEAAEAHRLLESRSVVGKLILDPQR
jgi:NADPH:quinone reductase